MVGIFVSVLQVIAIVNALVRSLQSRFAAGIVAAIVRGLLLAIVVVSALSRTPNVQAPGTDAPVPTQMSWAVLVAAVVGPIVSFAALWLAYRRKRDAPAAQEEVVGRPFTAWLPVALFDAAFVAINVFATVISNPF